ncbi:hypothetical protein LEP1GSC133_1942 [Leptospira borgpetersenii serovar Pomona str. 200901868]|uniref:Uncharacterized protein n=1 Tax=Leptospira borgpetersenii serovar Pomona str. 200901868 TaxID=1192866 RepID=M6W636_LEPBO|nr:hypothetical protein LEP1GSC133_1942 [Leptospira borgpetersenii serovar Pomona str. 200901868]
MDVAIETLSSFLQLTETKTRKETVNKKWILRLMNGILPGKILRVFTQNSTSKNSKENSEYGRIKSGNS